MTVDRTSALATQARAEPSSCPTEHRGRAPAQRRREPIQPRSWSAAASQGWRSPPRCGAGRRRRAHLRPAGGGARERVGGVCAHARAAHAETSQRHGIRLRAPAGRALVRRQVRRRVATIDRIAHRLDGGSMLVRAPLRLAVENDTGSSTSGPRTASSRRIRDMRPCRDPSGAHRGDRIRLRRVRRRARARFRPAALPPTLRSHQRPGHFARLRGRRVWRSSAMGRRLRQRQRALAAGAAGVDPLPARAPHPRNPWPGERGSADQRRVVRHRRRA